MIKIPLSTLNHQSRGEMVACSWGIHDDILILEAEQIPERIDGMFVPAQADKRSWFVTVYQGGELLFTLPAVESKTNFHYVQRVGDDQILLVGARCHYNGGKPDKNAALYNHYGQLINRFTLGDGIEQLNVTASNEVWVGYFDEGVFGNYGWGQPLGQYGLVKFDLEGHILWQADQFEILDCYAVNAESSRSFWFYYYSDFKLVHLQDMQPTTYPLPISGSHAFAICHPYIIMGGGYNHNDKFTVFKKNNQHLKKTDELVFTDEKEKSLTQYVYNIRGNQVIAYNQNNIYFTNLSVSDIK